MMPRRLANQATGVGKMNDLVEGSFFLPCRTLMATGMAYDTPSATTDLVVVSQTFCTGITRLTQKQWH